MELRAQSAQLTLRELELGDQMLLQEVRLVVTDLSAEVPIGTGRVAGSLSLTAVISEASLNKVIQEKVESPVRDLEIGLLTGKVRISGRYEVMGPFAVPFTFTAVPEIEGGARLRLSRFEFGGLVAAIPGAGAQAVGEMINARLAEHLDVGKIKLPIRLTGITTETGRLVVTAEAALEFTPPASSVPARC